MEEVGRFRCFLRRTPADHFGLHQTHPSTQAQLLLFAEVEE